MQLGQCRKWEQKVGGLVLFSLFSNRSLFMLITNINFGWMVDKVSTNLISELCIAITIHNESILSKL